MTALPENHENNLNTLDTALTGLEQQVPSIEVFQALMRLNHQLVETYMGLSNEADKEAAHTLDQRLIAVQNQVLSVLQAVEERKAAEVVALHTRAERPAQRHGRHHSLRQLRDGRPQDLQRAA